MMADDLILLPGDPLASLNEQTDLFGLLPKAVLIKNVLTQQLSEHSCIKMAVLFGPWGSGKTTLMNYLIDELKNSGVTPILFKAWQLERDSDLALSLLEQLVDEGTQKGEERKKALMMAGRTLFTLAKNLVYNVSLSSPVFSLNPGKAAVETSKELDAYYEEKSCFAKVREFKKEFAEFEDKLASENRRILVLIDDLDRCEPENVLNLLSAIKLFFTYSSRITYFCGIDKSAVSAAIRTKYRDIVNHEDYLEKIFDISFHMPEQYDVSKILKHCFPQKTDGDLAILRDFFNAIGFHTPRHVIKALNKYNLLKQYKRMDGNPSAGLIPDICEGEHIITVIFTLFIIILFEFQHKSFLEVLCYDEKFNSYVQGSDGGTDNRNSRDPVHGNKVYFNKLVRAIPSILICRETFLREFEDPDMNCLFSLINFFAPAIQGKYTRKTPTGDMAYYISQFESGGSHILTDFCKYLTILAEGIRTGSIDTNGLTPFRVFDLFRMAQVYF